MSRRVTNTVEQLDAMAPILRVLEDVAARRIAGEEVSDEAVEAAHPDLMPALGEKLAALRSADRARRIATDSTAVVDRGSAGDDDAFLPELEMPPPHAFRGYEILEEVGRGAMGVVYRAKQLSTAREVAIKVMVEGPFAGPHDRDRFQREARVLAQLKHPNVVTVYDTGVGAGRFYIVMDYISGDSLDAFVASRKLPIRQRLELFARICDAVSAAHLRGIIHRDLKPSNIRVDDDGEPHVLDFGLAKTADEGDDGASAAHSLTMTGQFVGSLPWASPEQAEGSPGQVDVRTDVYALGIVFYQMLTGRFPYPVVGHIRSVVDNIVLAEPRRPSTISKEIDNDIETIVLKCLAKERDRRYQSAGELARDVRHYLAGEPIEAKRDSGFYVLQKSLRRHKVAVGVAALFAVLLVGFSINISVMYSRAQRDAQRARSTLSFLQDTLFTASSQRLGAEATLPEVLDEASQRLDREFASQPDVAAALHYTIGHAYSTLWKPTEALEHLRAALDLYTRTYGREHAETVQCMVLLGMVLAETRDPAAVGLQQEALVLRLKRYGEDHVLVAESKYLLAYSLWRVPVPRRWEDAERYYTEAVSEYRRHLGTEHPDIARCLHAFAAMYRALGRFDEAEPLYRESLAMSRKLLGDEHQFVNECMMGYAIVLEKLGRFDEAEGMLRQLLVVAPKQFGKTALPNMMRRMAGLFLAKSDFAAAQEWFDDSIITTCALLSARKPEQADRLDRLVEVIREADEDGPGVAGYRETVLAIYELGGGTRNAVENFLFLARLWMAEGSPGGPASAEPLLREAVRILDEAPGVTSLYRNYVKNNYGDCLTRLGRFEEAEPLLVETHAALLAEVGEIHPITRKATTHLIDLYEAWGDGDKAASYRATLPDSIRR